MHCMRNFRLLVASGVLCTSVAIQIVGAAPQAVKQVKVVRLQGNKAKISALAFSGDGLTVAGGGADGTVRLWDARTGKVKRTLQGHASVTSIAFSPKGDTVACGGLDQRVRLWNARTGELKRALRAHRYQVTSVAFSPDGHILASGGWDRMVKLWDTRTGERKRVLIEIPPIGHPFERRSQEVFAVAFSPDGKTLASGERDPLEMFAGQVNLWDVREGVLRQQVSPGEVTSIAFSHDGRTLVSGNKDGEVRLFDTQTGKLKWKGKGHIGAVTTVTFSPDGKTVASASAPNRSQDKRVRLWDASTGKLKGTPQAKYSGPVIALSFFPRGSTLIGGTATGEIVLWSGNVGHGGKAK